jgi:hypothetical protein
MIDVMKDNPILSKNVILVKILHHVKFVAFLLSAFNVLQHTILKTTIVLIVPLLV